MAKVTIQKCNFTSGELNPDLEARTDIAQYGNGARELLNVLPVIEGGVKRRPGTMVLSLVTAFAANYRLIPFIINQQDVFILGFGNNSLAIRDRNGAVVSTKATPWDLYTINVIQVVQQDRRMWIVDGIHPPKLLSCSADMTVWSLIDFVIDVAPFDEINPTPVLSCTPSAKDPLGASITLTLSANGWSAGDVSKFVAINGGLVEITGYTSATVVNARIIQVLNAVVTAIPNSWTLKQSVWSADLGYPKTVTYFKQRLVFGGTSTYPNTIWASRIGNEHSFLLSTLDADAFAVKVSSNQVNPIAFLSQSRGIVVLTDGSEFLLASGNGAFSPTNVQATEYSTHGCSKQVTPIRAGDELLFAQLGGQRVRALSYRYEVDGLVSPDVSALATHIARNHGGIMGMCYQQEPNSIVWAWLGDGRVASLTLDRDQEVVAWAQHDFGGFVQSMISVPNTNGITDVYLLVKRGSILTLEILSELMRVDAAISGFVTDGGFSVLDGTAAPLNGKDVVACWGNRVVDVESVVAGVVTLAAGLVPNGGNTVHVGLPFTSRVVPFPPELSSSPSTAMQNKAKLDRITMVLKNTLGITLNGDLVDLQTHDEAVLGVDPALFTGRHVTEKTGWSDLHGLNIVIEQTQPLPFQLLALIYDLSANEK